ncbi:MAG: hypothetical protein F6J93_21225 [Oscillatoria sp. SIO1A7]|nr:hypothetical protein [Oscillatoria sp. SIO1A7]
MGTIAQTLHPTPHTLHPKKTYTRKKPTPHTLHPTPEKNLHRRRSRPVGVARPPGRRGLAAPHPTP